MVIAIMKVKRPQPGFRNNLEITSRVRATPSTSNTNRKYALMNRNMMPEIMSDAKPYRLFVCTMPPAVNPIHKIFNNDPHQEVNHLLLHGEWR
jgi:hypothetical protein